MSEFTPGCMRAAKRLAGQLCYDREKIAAVIAEETAAPEQNAVLQRLNREFGEITGGGPNCRPTVAQLNSWWTDIRAALAKSKGTDT